MDAKDNSTLFSEKPLGTEPLPDKLTRLQANVVTQGQAMIYSSVSLVSRDLGNACDAVAERRYREASVFLGEAMRQLARAMKLVDSGVRVMDKESGEPNP